MPVAVKQNYDLAALELDGNHGKVLPQQLAWLPSLPATASAEEIRAALEKNGVVHVKGVMPREYVVEHRKRYFDIVRPSGIIKEDSSSEDAVYNDAADPELFTGLDASKYNSADEQSKYVTLQLEAIHSDWAKAFCSNKYIKEMVQRINPDWTEPFVFKRQIWRTNPPHAQGTQTGVHYDHIFIRGGPPTALTAWVPVGDCNPLQGGLMYLENSVPLARELEDDFTARAAASGFSPEEAMSAFNQNMGVSGMLSTDPGQFACDFGKGRRWLVADYEAGDVVFHHSMAIHAATANRDPEDRIRLSCDLRYGDRKHAYDARWDQNVYLPNDGL